MSCHAVLSPIPSSKSNQPPHSPPSPRVCDLSPSEGIASCPETAVSDGDSETAQKFNCQDDSSREVSEHEPRARGL
eukprot:6273336-Amphidinium_carterae.2